ncbi:MAG: hypothetical protein GF400_06310 [Candidatus Eisenbacteria bacterium]|nr:hypothetical protein [Candidatus Eisenbacteria bacterium]
MKMAEALIRSVSAAVDGTARGPLCYAELRRGRLGKTTSRPSASFKYLLALAVLASALLPSCTTGDSPTDPDEDLPTLPIASRAYELGIAGLVARNSPDPSEQDFLDFLAELPLMGERSGVYVAWDADYPVDEQVEVILTYSSVGVLAGVGFNHENVTADYFDVYGDSLKSVAVALATEFDLDYLAIGAEVNRVRDECCQEAWDEFVAVYAETYDAVKAVSPSTKVFTIFQLDYMKGAARLSGLDLQPSWHMLDLFEGRLDVVGLTVYPFLEHPTVAEVPTDYFDEIAQHIDEPIVITESGWLSEPLELWGNVEVEGSEQEQVDFVLMMIEQIEQLDVEILMYSFLYEYDESIDMFHHIALRENAGPAKEVYWYWRALAELPLR